MKEALALVVLSACLHAGWNVIARRERATPSTLLSVPLYASALGLAPAIATEIAEPILSRRLLGLLLVSGVFQAAYLVGLVRMYAAAELSVVYPLTRALPVLLLAVIDAVWGRGSTWLGVTGMFLVAAGSVLAPRTEKDAAPALPWRTAVWLGVVIVGTVGYTIADKVAMDSLPVRTSIAARYCVWETFASVPFLAVAAAIGWTPRPDPSAARDAGTRRRWIVATAVLSFASYGLVLCAYQLGAQASWVSALRQISIPLGVAASRVVLGERVTPARIAGALVIATGVACLVLGVG